MDENEILEKLNALHSKILKSQFAQVVTESEIRALTEYEDMLNESKQYQAIGTVEECREAVEKQKAKEPVKDEYNHTCCPSCGWIVYKDEYGGRYLPHCENCGQAIDWSDIE